MRGDGFCEPCVLGSACEPALSQHWSMDERPTTPDTSATTNGVRELTLTPSYQLRQLRQIRQMRETGVPLNRLIRMRQDLEQPLREQPDSPDPDHMIRRLCHRLYHL